MTIVSTITATPVGTVTPLMPAMEVLVEFLSADADMVDSQEATQVADIDIVIACVEVSAGLIAQCDVAAAGCLCL